MKLKFLLLGLFIIVLALFRITPLVKGVPQKAPVPLKQSHWFILDRKSAKEHLYFGVAGDVNNSLLLKTFQVKTGNRDTSPTPLPQLLGREYWLVINKESSSDNPETAPYFLTLDIPAPSESPFGPTPYKECIDHITGEAAQCNWTLPGFFGLHGVNANIAKLSKEDSGSSGCIRHSDEDITYLYQILNPEKEEIRYYIKDI